MAYGVGDGAGLPPPPRARHRGDGAAALAAAQRRYGDVFTVPFPYYGRIVYVARTLTAPARIAGHELSAGAFVLPAIGALHYREDLFPEPHRFRPERFTEGSADNHAWIPFGGGVRRCIGAAFAEYEMRTILREFVRRAELRPAGRKPERVRVRNITLTPARGARVVLQKRLAA